MSKLNEVMDLQLRSLERLTEVMSSILDRQQDLDLRIRELIVRQEAFEEQTRKALLSLAQQ